MGMLEQLLGQGQSVWIDYLRRSFITSGELAAMIASGLRGVTSNPSIFEKAIAGSTDYDADLNELLEAGRSAREIYEHLALEDIRLAADELRPVYDRTLGEDGYVSLEVSPDLADNTEGTIVEARRLFDALDRPNVMIKVPATRAGIPAVETLIGEGLNINITLLFSLDRYQAFGEAYLAGLEKLAARGGDLRQVASVASFFISRVDVKTDRALEAVGADDLLGKIAIANGKMAYQRFRQLFRGERWNRLLEKGARLQRVLWASTSTKNPHYPDTLYVDELIGPHTVNTLPPATFSAFQDHGKVAPTLEVGLEEAEDQLTRLAELGINLADITDQLLEEGLASFDRSMQALFDRIEQKRETLQSGWQLMETSLGPYQTRVAAALADMEESRVLARLWNHDHTLWKPEPAEITNRLGWLHSPDLMLENLDRVEALVADVQADGYQHALLLGMGGSSLAPEVFSEAFSGGMSGNTPRISLEVLDTTDPGALLAAADRLDYSRTLLIVSTKSGGTVETLSFFKYFYQRTAQSLGGAAPGDHFIAITDPGSSLAKLAEQYQFRAIFLNDPNIGGRYSALSYFGLVPAALVSVDLPRLLDKALTSATSCDSCVGVEHNPGAHLGAVLGELALAGRDKLTLVLSPSIQRFGDWVEQLIAESTGKEGLGILPVVEETLGQISSYAADRLFVHLRLPGEGSHDATIQALEEAGHPVVRLHLRERYDLGGQFFLWELATAIAGQRLGINPFDQPNVESAKVQARNLVAAYQERGQLPDGAPALLDEGISVYGLSTERTAPAALAAFLAQAGDQGSPMAASARPYVAIQAFVRPTEATTRALRRLRNQIRGRFHLATTLGYGPRFLHSTGQLHKGDAGAGLFVQFTSDADHDAPIPTDAGAPDSSITFGVLKLAQALGDLKALQDSGRRVIRFHLGKDVVNGLRRLTEGLA